MNVSTEGSRKRAVKQSSQRLGCSHDGVGCDAQLLHDNITGGRHACHGASKKASANVETKLTEAVDADCCTVKANILGPRARDTSLNGHAFAATAGQNAFFVVSGLLVKTMLRGHGDDTSAGAELGSGSDGMLQLAATGQNDGVKGRSLVHCDIAAGQDTATADLNRYLGQIGEGLTREAEHSRTVGASERSDESSCSFLGVSRAND